MPPVVGPFVGDPDETGEARGGRIGTGTFQGYTADAEVGRSSAKAEGWAVKFTKYFEEMRRRPDRAMIRMEWIQRVVENPVQEAVQQDGRIRRWAPVEENQGQYLRVVLLPDGETVHNAFFDRSFTR